MSKRPVGECDGCAKTRALSQVFDRRLCDACVKALPDPPASVNQRAYLRGLGVTVEGFVSRQQASRLIDEAAGKRPATEKQLAYLRELCVSFQLPLSQAAVQEWIELAYAARDYAWKLFDEEFQPKRGPKGQFAKGSLKGVTIDFAERQTGRMRRFILSDPKLREAVLVILMRGLDIPQDETRAAVLSHLQRPSETPSDGSLLARLFAWLFG
jgi:hypothetical protein